MPRTLRPDVSAEGRDRRGCAEGAKLEVGLPEERPGDDRRRRRRAQPETGGSGRASRQPDRHTRRPRDAGAIAAARGLVLQRAPLSLIRRAGPTVAPSTRPKHWTVSQQTATRLTDVSERAAASEPRDRSA